MNTKTNESKRILSEYLEGHSSLNEGCLTIAFGCEGGGKNYQLHAKHLNNILRKYAAEWEGEDRFPAVRDSIIAQGESIANDGERWSGAYEGVCLHLSATDGNLVKLPASPKENSWAGLRFRLRPAFAALASQREMLALSLSFKAPKLYRFDGHAVTLCGEVELPEDVYSFSDSEVVDQGQRAHVRRSSGSEGPQLSQQGVSREQSPRDLNEPVFLREVKRALEAFDEAAHLPLVVVGDESIMPQFLKVYEHPQGEVFSVSGEQSHPDESDVAEICRRLCRENYEKANDSVIDQMNSADAEGNLFSTNVKEIVQAAENGRIEQCVVASDAEIWLRRVGFDSVKAAEPEDATEVFEALDCIVSESVMKGAAVAVVADEVVPGGKSVAAIFRW